MSLAHRPDGAIGLPAACRLVDVTFSGAFVVAPWVCVATGTPPVTAVAVASVVADDALAGGAPFGRRRTRLGRLTAVHPSVESRLARQGVAPGDVAEQAAVERLSDD